MKLFILSACIFIFAAAVLAEAQPSDTPDADKAIRDAIDLLEKKRADKKIPFRDVAKLVKTIRYLKGLFPINKEIARDDKAMDTDTSAPTANEKVRRHLAPALKR